MNQSRIKPVRMLIYCETIADKQANTNQEQAKTEDAKRHDKEQV
ncbi:twin arginine translocase protein A [Escherichia coli]|uniref:Twin arginine translocase protein A n=1 Tax=Escherichia coli TaxID=562 RepID=A0A376TQT7_ECOLX|nr:twin arginine translocase protein A [Escherichia coli]